MNIQLLITFLLYLFGSGHSCTEHSCAAHTAIVHAATLDDDSRIEWSANHRLTWNDFQATPPYNKRWTSNIAAITSSVIQYRYSCENGYLEYDIKSIFLPDESWVKDNARTDDYLTHEQLHFDITELFARKLRNRLLGKSFKCDEVQRFEDEIKVSLDEWLKVQKTYDFETSYSLDLPEQRKWNDYVERLLNIYEASAE